VETAEPKQKTTEIIKFIKSLDTATWFSGFEYAMLLLRRFMIRQPRIIRNFQFRPLTLIGYASATLDTTNLPPEQGRRGSSPYLAIGG
jgi:hypothetical protein